MSSIRDLFENGKRPNLLFIITDQERQLQHWPPDFCKLHLPSMTQLQQTGLTFNQAFTNACMCSPSRATLLTSQYPSLTGVTTTGSPQPKYALPMDSITLANVLKEAGYTTIEWQGKWHLGNTPQDYGFTNWDPPDAGNYLMLNHTLGGGIPANDVRFLYNILNFIKQQQDHQSKDEDQPWCLVASFVNPHDVYIAQHYNVEDAGYHVHDLHRIHVPLPTNCHEKSDNNKKPRAHAQMSWHSDMHTHCCSMQEYVNFYAHLCTLVDAQIQQVLDQLESCHQTERTLIFRFADHGEQALSHGLVEKFYNVYEESIHIPLIVSNPTLKVCGQQTESFASLLDIVPTLADLLGVSNAFEKCFYGTSLVPVIEDHYFSIRKEQQQQQQQQQQQLVHFTYDDIQSRNHAPSMIRCVRTDRYKYAVYFTPNGKDADWELYDLQDDADENDNVAGQANYTKIQLELDIKLQKVMQEMKTCPELFKWPPKATPFSRGVFEF